MGQEADVVVIGTGAFGASVAYHLARRGTKNVVLVDRHELASQTSPRAAGLFKQSRPTELMLRLAVASVKMIETFTADTGEPMDYVRSGAIMIARTPAQEELVRDEVVLGQELGLDIDIISVAEARRLSPFLEPNDIRLIAYTRDDIYLEPAQVPVGYVRAAGRLGVTLLPQTSVMGIRVQDGEVAGVFTDQGEIAAPVVVSAAGAWTPALGLTVGYRVPVVPTRHQLLITEPIDGVEPGQPIMRIGDAGVYLRPCRGGLMLGGYEADPLQYATTSLPTSVQDVPLDLAVLRRLADRVLDQLPILKELDVNEHRGGLPTLTPDGQHVVGPVPGVRGLFVLSGCCVAGLSISPSLGKALADWIVDGDPGYDLSSMSPARFGPEFASDDALRSASRECYAQIYSTL